MKSTRTAPGFSTSAGWAMVAIVAAYLALTVPTVWRHGISWDEQTDLEIADVYARAPGGWWVGTEIDAGNTRLPMYLGGVAAALRGQATIADGRLLSCVAGVGTLLGLLVAGRLLFGDRAAWVATVAVAVSPLFVAFSGVGYTEGDVWVTCGACWLLATLAALEERRTLGRAVAVAIAFGLAVSAKISAVAFAPAIAVAAFDGARSREGGAGAIPALPRRARRIGFGALAVVGGVVAAGWGRAEADPRVTWTASAIVDVILMYAIAVAATAGLVTAAAIHRDRAIGPWSGLWLIGGLGAVVFFLLPPVHMTNAAVVKALFHEMLYSDAEFSWAFVREAAILHGTVLLVKPSLAIGIAIAVGAVAMLRGIPRCREWRLLAAFVLPYLAFLLRMPRAQPFYTMPVFPALVLCGAAVWAGWAVRARRAATVAAAIVALSVAVDLALSWPDTHLNGFQWLGARAWGGRPTIGVRGVVQVPTDGVEQALRWVDRRTHPDETVMAFLGENPPDRIIGATVPDRRYLLAFGDLDPDPLTAADWVITTLTARLRPGHGAKDPGVAVYARSWDDARLGREFEPVFEVPRRFGLSAARVWRRRGGDGSPVGDDRATAVSPAGLAAPAQVRAESRAVHADRAEVDPRAWEAVVVAPRSRAERTIESTPGETFGLALAAVLAGAEVAVVIDGGEAQRMRIPCDGTRIVTIGDAASAGGARDGAPITRSWRVTNLGPGRAVVLSTRSAAELARWRGEPSGPPESWAAAPVRLPLRDAEGLSAGIVADPFDPSQRVLRWDVTRWNEFTGIGNGLNLGTVWCGPGAYRVRMRLRTEGNAQPVPIVRTGDGKEDVLVRSSPTGDGKEDVLVRSSPAGDGKEDVLVRSSPGGEAEENEPAGSVLARDDWDWTTVEMTWSFDRIAKVWIDLLPGGRGHVWVDDVVVEADPTVDTTWVEARRHAAAAAAADDPGRALVEWRRAIWLDRAVPGARTALPGLLAETGDTDAAIVAARTLAGERARDPAALTTAAAVLDRCGAGKEARRLRAAVAALQPSVPVDVAFDCGVRLLGWDPPVAASSADDTVTMRLYWTVDWNLSSDWAAIARVQRDDCEVFAHAAVLRDESGRPSRRWAPGEIAVETRQLPAAMVADPGWIAALEIHDANPIHYHARPRTVILDPDADGTVNRGR